MNDHLFEIDENTGFKWSLLENKKWSLGIKTETLLTMINSQEDTLENLLETLETRIKKDNFYNTLPVDVQGSYFSTFFFEYEVIIKDLERTQRNAALISIFSFFEGFLKDLCDAIDKKFSFVVKQNDLNRNGIDRSFKYLKKVFGIDDSNYRNDWDKLKPFKTARNVFAHGDGSYIGRKPELENINGLKNENMALYFRVSVEDLNTLSQVILSFEKISKKIFTAIDIRYDELKNG